MEICSALRTSGEASPSSPVQSTQSVSLLCGRFLIYKHIIIISKWCKWGRNSVIVGRETTWERVVVSLTACVK